MQVVHELCSYLQNMSQNYIHKLVKIHTQREIESLVTKLLSNQKKHRSMQKLFFSISLLISFIPFIFSQMTVVDVIVNSPDHNTLETAVLAAGLEGTLSGDGPFTVFAPTDAAFAVVDADALNSLLADPEGALTDVLLNHVVSGVADGSNISDGTAISSLLGQTLTFTVNDSGIFINDAQVTVADIKTDNGVVHVIDAVLIPNPTATRVDGTIMDVVSTSPVHTQLNSLIAAAGLDDDLSSAGPFTLFAPTDDAVAALPMEVTSALLADPTGALADVLLYHAVSGVASSSVLSDGLQFSNLAGANLTVSVNDDGVFINDAKVSVADIYTNNGIVHVIDAVIVPPMAMTVLDIIDNSPVHTQLSSLIRAAELDGALSGDGPFTVFAPTDDAIAALPADVVSSLVADPTGALANVLLFHVASGVADTSNITDGLSIGSLSGNNLTFAANDSGVTVNGINISVADIKTSNGVVHVIDAVLVP